MQVMLSGISKPFFKSFVNSHASTKNNKKIKNLSGKKTIGPMRALTERPIPQGIKQ